MRASSLSFSFSLLSHFSPQNSSQLLASLSLHRSRLCRVTPCTFTKEQMKMSPLTSHPEPIQSPQGGAWLPALTCRGTHCLASFRCYGKPNCENLHILLCIRRNQMLPHGTLTRNTGNEENLQEQVSPRIQYHASKDGNDGQPEVLNGLHARILGLKKKSFHSPESSYTD